MKDSTRRTARGMRAIAVSIISVVALFLSALAASSTTRGNRNPAHGMAARTTPSSSTSRKSPVSGRQQGSSKGPNIYLQESQSLPVTHVGTTGGVRDLAAAGAQAISMATSDFDEDGVADLVVGYSAP